MANKIMEYKFLQSIQILKSNFFGSLWDQKLINIHKIEPKNSFALEKKEEYLI